MKIIVKPEVGDTITSNKGELTITRIGDDYIVAEHDAGYAQMLLNDLEVLFIPQDGDAWADGKIDSDFTLTLDKSSRVVFYTFFKESQIYHHKKISDGGKANALGG